MVQISFKNEIHITHLSVYATMTRYLVLASQTHRNLFIHTSQTTYTGKPRLSLIFKCQHILIVCLMGGL